MGLPGAGKTTAAKLLEDITGAVRLSSDEARLMLWDQPEFSESEHQELYDYLDDQTKHLLQSGRSVIYDANLNRYEHRKQKYELANQLHADTILCWVKTPRETARKRRIDDVEHHHLVTPNEDPATMFDRVANVIEDPQSNENYLELDGTKLTKQYINDRLDGAA